MLSLRSDFSCDLPSAFIIQEIDSGQNQNHTSPANVPPARNAPLNASEARCNGFDQAQSPHGTARHTARNTRWLAIPRVTASRCLGKVSPDAGAARYGVWLAVLGLCCGRRGQWDTGREVVGQA